MHTAVGTGAVCVNVAGSTLTVGEASTVDGAVSIGAVGLNDAVSTLTDVETSTSNGAVILQLYA